MHHHRSTACAAVALALLFLLPWSSAAQLRGRPFVSGLTHPLAFVQDPSHAGLQYIVEQGGTIRIVQGGALLSAPFLDLSGVIANGGERGLLGLAFPPDYAASGRFYVTFVNTDNNVVVSRFHRSLDPLVADPQSRFDLQWSTGNRYIAHPGSYHYGGNLVFGSDGALYIGTGDGGEPNDATHQAQNTSSLLGKILRVNVGVGDEDPEGLDIPAGNPFAAGGGAPEVWSIGLRNPWRFTMDDPARGGTGALVIGDVGEDAFEELDYEPAGRAGRNYGWRNREGAHDHETSLPPAYLPLTDPTFEYDHSFGRSITGGYVYRGSTNPTMVGRYVFGDFVRGRVWSIALTIDPGSGEATASDFRDHTTEISSGAAVGQISSFGVDASGEIYVVNWGAGTVVALRASQGSAPILRIDSPFPGSPVRQPFALTGWALDATAATPGIGTVHVWAFSSTGVAQFLGVASYGVNRPDVAALYGPQFAPSGFTLTVKGLALGDWLIGVYGWVNATQTFSAIGSVGISVQPAGIIAVDLPANGSTVPSPFVLTGWAMDPAAITGTGVATIHVWAFSADGVPPVFLGAPSFGPRTDVAAIFGAQFLNAGYGMVINSLPPGTWQLGIYMLSTVSGQFDTAQAVTVRVGGSQ